MAKLLESPSGKSSIDFTTGYTANSRAAREDLADLIANVDKRNTPFTSMATKGRTPSATYFEWLLDNYADPQSTGIRDGVAITEGSAELTNPAPNRARMGNFIQIFRRAHAIGMLAENVSNPAGARSEKAAGIQKILVEIKRDMEVAMCAYNQDAQADDGSTKGYRTKSLGSFLEANGNAGSSGAPQGTIVPSSFRIESGAIETTATTANMTDTTIQDVLKAIFDATGETTSYIGLVGSTLKRAFTDRLTGTISSGATNVYTQVRMMNQKLGENIFKNTISIFEGDFGTINLVPTNWIGSIDNGPSDDNTGTGTWTAAAQKGYILNMNMVEVKYHDMPKVSALPDQGGGPRYYVQAVAGLCVKSPKACGFLDLGS